MNRNMVVQVWILFGLTLANFITQVPYYLRLYYTPQHVFPDLKSLITMGTVFAFFIVSASLFIKGQRIGYYLLLIFLVVEFAFYSWNTVGGVIHGYGWFFHLTEHDPILWTVFAIGYLNLFVSGYWLALLLYRRNLFLKLTAKPST